MIMKATIELKCKHPKTVAKSLKPDILKRDDIKVSLEPKKKTLVIKIESEKISYLKAAINSYLSLVKMLNELD